jgi:hypothetical protein
MDRNISRLRNGLQLDGKEASDGSVIYLQDADGSVFLGADVNGNLYGTAFGTRVGAVTANDDGLTTAIIPANLDFVTITSAGATKAVTLPTASASTIGRTMRLYVGANGLELLSASGNQTINTVDADGTNQLDVAANSMLVATQVSATGWYIYQVTATTITVVAPDND